MLVHRANRLLSGSTLILRTLVRRPGSKQTLGDFARSRSSAGRLRSPRGAETRCLVPTIHSALAILLATGAGITHYEVPMVRANCRARFTAADFDFIVRTLARSQTDQVSLVDLLSDVETRDSILDHPRLVDAILNQCGHLRISS